MSGHWNEIRRLAGQFRDTLAIPRQPIPPANAVVDAALKATGLKSVATAPMHVMLAGAQAVLDPEARRIWYDNTLDDATAQLVIAHEIAHHRLHGDRSTCTAAQATMSAHDSASTSGLAVVEGYGPEERREHEANLFARELLLPADDARVSFIRGLKLSAFVKQTGLPEAVLAQHLVYSLLVSDLVDHVKGKNASTKQAEPNLDSSQRNAATAECPALVVAGPGTGKTRALVARVMYLLERGVEASSILALTYSNKAAEEMRDRIAAFAPEAAVKMWVGTFHAFGLDVLRRYGTRIGVPAKPEVLSQVDGLLLLERDLSQLALDQYLNLWDPARFLRDILSAISRAKDELLSPAQYLALADAMAVKATDPKQREEAVQAQEVARVYAHYDSRVRGMGALDFGDLIARAVEVLRHSDGVARAELRAQFRHIVVDEFQDVNRASAVLLKELAGEGNGLWAVGDVRQSIYRFRGAAPANVRDFGTLFPGAKTVSLDTNYRAQPPIVATYAALAPLMKASDGQKFETWDVDRPNTCAEVLMRVADTGEVEGDGIGSEIQRLASRANDPIPYREQAVLCRSHLTLERIARRLEAAGVPVLYLGDLFEREEVRDLMSLLALACEPDGRSLIRVARFRIYGIPLSDVLLLIRTARERDVPFPRAFELLDDSSIGVSPQAESGLNRLRHDLEGLSYGTSAWSMLAHYLLERSEYVDALLGDSTLAARQKRLAIYQFLQFALEQLDVSRIAVPSNEFRDPKRIFLDFVRRLAIYGDERQLRQVPDWAAGLDAVRLMTIHASKGLEFRAVFVPYLGARYMPSSKRPMSCRPPTGMIQDTEIDTHLEEEECLFFVALSRARDVLCLSRAKRYGKQNSKASKLLEAIAVALPLTAADESHWRAEAEPDSDEAGAALSGVEEFAAKDLDVYMKCPRMFFYEKVLGLHHRIDASAYVGFHRAVYDVLGWMRGEVGAGRLVDVAAVRQRFEEAWVRLGPHTHPYAPLYEVAARALIERARLRLGSGLGEISQPTWVLPLEHGRISVNPEYVEMVDSGDSGPPLLRVCRIRTGKPTASEHEKELYGLYAAGAEAYHPGCRREIETLYLTTDEVRPVALTAAKTKTRLAKYDKAMVGVRRGSFEATPDDHICPRCPNFFICPTAEDGSPRPVEGNAA